MLNCDEHMESGDWFPVVTSHLLVVDVLSDLYFGNSEPGVV